MVIRTRSPKATPRAGQTEVEWTPAPTEFLRRSVLMEVYGDTGTGRTSLALTAPGPVALVHAAEKIDGVVQQFAQEKDIQVVDFGGTFWGSAEVIMEQAAPVVAKLQGAWYDAVDGWARSVVLDTHTEAWEVLRLARFGTVTPRGRMDNLYGPVNAEWRSMFKHARAQQKSNVIVIGQTKDEYKESKSGTGQRTGKTIRAGQKEVPFMADVIVRTARTKEGAFTATIEKGWFNAYSEGLTLEDEDVRFETIMALVTETDEEEWL